MVAPHAPTRVGPGPNGYIELNDAIPLLFPLYALQRYDTSARCPQYDPRKGAWLIAPPIPDTEHPLVDDYIEALKHPFFVHKGLEELAWTPSNHASYRVFMVAPTQRKQGGPWGIDREPALDLCDAMDRLMEEYSAWFDQLPGPRPLLLSQPGQQASGNYAKAKDVVTRDDLPAELLQQAMGALFAWYARALGWLIHARMSLLASPHSMQEQDLVEQTKWLHQKAMPSWEVTTDLFTQSMSHYLPYARSPGVVLHGGVSDELANAFLAQRVRCWDLLRTATPAAAEAMRCKWGAKGPASGLIHTTAPLDGRPIHEQSRQVIKLKGSTSEWREWRHDLASKPYSLKKEWRENRKQQEQERPEDDSADSDDSLTQDMTASARAEAARREVPAVGNAWKGIERHPEVVHLPSANPKPPGSSARPASPVSPAPTPPPLPAQRPPSSLPDARPLPLPHHDTTPRSGPSPTNHRRQLCRGQERSRSHPALPESPAPNPPQPAVPPVEGGLPDDAKSPDHESGGPLSPRSSRWSRSLGSSLSRSPAGHRRHQSSHSGASRTRSQSPPRFQPYPRSSSRPGSSQRSRKTPDTSGGRGATSPSTSTSQLLSGLGLDPGLLQLLTEHSHRIEVTPPGGSTLVFNLAQNVDQTSTLSSRSILALRPDAKAAPSLASRLSNGGAPQERPSTSRTLAQRLQRSQPHSVPPQTYHLRDRLTDVGPSHAAAPRSPPSSRMSLAGVPEERPYAKTSRRPPDSVVPSTPPAPQSSAKRASTLGSRRWRGRVPEHFWRDMWESSTHPVWREYLQRQRDRWDEKPIPNGRAMSVTEIWKGRVKFDRRFEVLVAGRRLAQIKAKPDDAWDTPLSQPWNANPGLSSDITWTPDPLSSVISFGVPAESHSDAEMVNVVNDAPSVVQEPAGEPTLSPPLAMKAESAPVNAEPTGATTPPAPLPAVVAHAPGSGDSFWLEGYGTDPYEYHNLHYEYSDLH